MNNATIGLLLSGLVFPGLGHLILKAYIRAFAIISLTLASFITILATIIQQTNAAIEKIQSENGKIDLDSVTQAMNQALSATDQSIYTISYGVLISCWLIGVIDGYRVGKQKDKEKTSAD
ncbi:MAG: hypothetical protein OEZ38_09055 [Gammaproteobacteria bacterium]|nr:hypothetical protein [Gammaproteobacteria bacterium]